MKSIFSLFSLSGKISRKAFTITGLVLFAIKYNLDRLIAYYFGRDWFISDYYMKADHLWVMDLPEEDQKFYMILLSVSVPFIWMGTVLCLKRLRDAGLPLWLVLLFFIPMLNLLFFFMLCLLPAEGPADNRDDRPGFLKRIIPVSKAGSALVAILITLLIALAFSFLSVNILNEYGWGLFVGIPFFIGFSSSLLYAYHHHPVSAGKSIGIGFIAISVFALMIFGLAMEGAICIAMAAPVAYAIALLGSLLAYAIQLYTPRSSLQCIGVHLLFLPLMMLVERSDNNTIPIYELKTGLIINESPQKVWNHLIGFSTIEPPKEWLFKTGIAYPTDAVIDGRGKGAVRKCNFTTGSFIEPITCWDEPRLLQFDVLKQPQPMFELSFYDHVEAVHLDGYFVSVRGQFKLMPLGLNKTYLEGTTWYKNKMWPLAYWKQWSDFILHKIHFRVLEHIKKTTEQDSS